MEDEEATARTPLVSPARLDPLAELEVFLSDGPPHESASSASEGQSNRGTSAAVVVPAVNTRHGGTSSAALVPIQNDTPRKKSVIDLSDELLSPPVLTPDLASKEIAKQLQELEEFAGPSIDAPCRQQNPDIADLQADMLLMDTLQGAPRSGGSSRALPKSTKKPASAAAKVAMKIAAPKPRGVCKSSAKKLATSRAWHKAKKAALDAGKSSDEASRLARAAYKKAAEAFPATKEF